MNCKFINIWPSKNALVWWRKNKWQPKGQIDLGLGEKGFFKVVFENVDERARVF